MAAPMQRCVAQQVHQKGNRAEFRVSVGERLMGRPVESRLHREASASRAVGRQSKETDFL